MFNDTTKEISQYKLIEKTDFVEYGDDIELIFVELPKFNKKLNELTNIKDQWIYFIKNAGSLEYIPTDLDSDVQKALDVANEANLTKDELEAQHKRKEFISIQKLALVKAKQDGLQEGIEKGLAQGIEKGIEKGLEQGIERALKKVSSKALRKA